MPEVSRTEARGPIDTGRRAEPFQPFLLRSGPAGKWQDAELGLPDGSLPNLKKGSKLESFLARKEADRSLRWYVLTGRFLPW